MGVFRQFTFNVIVGRYAFKSILLLFSLCCICSLGDFSLLLLPSFGILLTCSFVCLFLVYLVFVLEFKIYVFNVSQSTFKYIIPLHVQYKNIVAAYFMSSLVALE